MARRTRFACPDCGLPVIRARTEAMSWQLLDPVPDDAGNVHAYEAGGNWRARSVPPRTPAVPPDLLMMPHKATCAGKPPGRAETPAGLPEGVTGIAAWKAARAAQGKAARKRRGRRQKPVTGVRWGGDRG